MPWPRSQPSSFLPVTVVKKSAVAVNDPVLPLMEHGVDRLLFEQRMQRCAFAVLYAVIRPEGLRQAVEFALGVGFHLVLAGEAAVIRRVPVLAGDDGLAARQAPVDKRISHLDGTVAFRNRQRAAGAKVVLQINQ